MEITTDDDGQISISIEGGTEPYLVTWYMNDEVVGMGTEISGLPEGIYRAVIIDANDGTQGEVVFAEQYAK